MPGVTGIGYIRERQWRLGRATAANAGAANPPALLIGLMVAGRPAIGLGNLTQAVASLRLIAAGPVMGRATPAGDPPTTAAVESRCRQHCFTRRPQPLGRGVVAGVRLDAAKAGEGAGRVCGGGDIAVFAIDAGFAGQRRTGRRPQRG